MGRVYLGLHSVLRHPVINGVFQRKLERVWDRHFASGDNRVTFLCDDRRC